MIHLMKLLLPTVLAVFLVAVAAAAEHPVPENPLWLTFKGGEGPGAGKHIVLIAADQEYRSEQSMPPIGAWKWKRRFHPPAASSTSASTNRWKAGSSTRS